MAQLESLEQLIWELRRAFRELTAAADRELQVLGLHTPDRAFLEFLSRETEPISLSDLARKYSVSRQHIHQMLRRLPHPEWVEEIPDAADRRSVQLRLSRKGRSCWNQVRAVDKALLERLAGTLPQESVATTIDLLRRLRRQLPVGAERTSEKE